MKKGINGFCFNLGFYFLVPFITLLWGCSGPAGETKKDSLATAKQSVTAAKQPAVVAADEQKLVDRITIKPLLLFGKEVKTEYTKIQQLLAAEIPGMMSVLAQQKAVIKGSYYIALPEEPQSGKETRVFIGIPVNKELSATGYSMLKITSGEYIRTQVTAEPGTALVNHQNIRNTLEKLKIKTGFPILETYSETRNSDMTTVISKASFYYPQSK